MKGKREGNYSASRTIVDDMGHKKKPPQEDSIMYTKQRNSGDPPPAARHKVLGSSQVLCFETRQILSIS